MFQRFAGLFLAFIFMITSPDAAADQSKTSIFLTQGVTFPIGFDEPFGGALGVSEGVKISRGAWMVECGLGTSFTTFTPSLYVASGPAQALTKNILLAEGLSAKFVPSYGDLPASTGFGVSLTPIFLTKSGSVGTTVGVSCMVIGTPPSCGAALTVKSSLKVNHN